MPALFHCYSQKKILSETNQLLIAMETLKLFSAFIQDKYPRNLAAFINILSTFEQILKKHGG
ncbi:MAG: DUF1804 family protein [Sodalis sp. (in: enterobacteria)]